MTMRSNPVRWQRAPKRFRVQRTPLGAGIPAVLASASSWYDARDILTADQQTLASRVGSGVATFGSTTGSDFNDPARLPHDGTNYVWFPGASTTANRIQVPNESALQITGDIDIRLHIEPWDVAGFPLAQTLLRKDVDYSLYLLNTGVLRLRWWNGSASLPVDSTIALPTGDRVATHVRVTMDVDDGAGGRVITFYTSTDGTNWTQLGAAVTGTATAIVPSTGVLTVGANITAAESYYGKVFRAQVLNGIDGTTVLDVNPTTETLGQTGWTCTTGQTVTVNRATSGLTTAVVTRPLFLGDGTDDFVLLPTSDTPTITPTTGALTVLVVSRSWPTGGTTRGLLSWGQGAYQGLTLYESAGATLSVAARDGASGQAIDAQAIATGGNGNLVAKGFLVNNGQLVVADSVNGIGVSPVSLSALTSFSFSSQGRLDSAAGQVISSPRGGEYFAMVTWPRALTAQELADASTFLLGTYT